MENKLNIFVDMDDVLVDWTGQAFKTFGINSSNEKLIEMLEQEWGMQTILLESKMWEVIDSLGSDWWENLPKLPWADRLYSLVKSKGNTCVLTSPNKSPGCIIGKINWIDKNLYGTRDFLIGKPKHFCANSNSLLIDDRPENCNKFVECGGNAFLWPSPHTMKKNDPDGSYTINAVFAMISKIEFYIRENISKNFYDTLKFKG